MSDPVPEASRTAPATEAVGSLVERGVRPGVTEARQSMSDHGRFIVVTAKPRLLRHHNGWMCVGLQRITPRWWFRRERMVTRFGVSPKHAFYTWLLALDGRA